MHYFKTFLIFLLISSASFAGKTYNLEIVIRDIYSNKILPNCPVRVMDGDNSIQQISDAKGIVHFEGILNKVVAITIITKNGDYDELDFNVELSKKRKFNNFKAFLYPSSHKKSKLILKEDSLYGVIDSISEVDFYNDTINNSSSAFQGGVAGLQSWISQNIRYPEYSIDNDEQGRIYLSFVIEVDGSISHIKIDKGVSMTLDRESIRVVQSMPKWIPGKSKGVPVRTIARMPIVFAID